MLNFADFVIDPFVLFFFSTKTDRVGKLYLIMMQPQIQILWRENAEINIYHLEINGKKRKITSS